MNDRSPALVFSLLLALILLPAGCILWFMNEAVTTQSAVARQQVLEAHRGQLRLVRARIDAHWRAQAARLQGGGDPARRFARIVRNEIAEGAVLLDADGSVVFPDSGEGYGAVVAARSRLDAAERLTGAEAGAHVPAVAALLNDYGVGMTGEERLALMARLRRLAPNVSLPTEAALRLSFDLLGSERPSAKPGGLRETAIPDVWALTSDDGLAIGLYRTGRLEAMMHDFLHQVTPAGIRFIALPPDIPGGAEAIAAGPWMPGWQLTFQPVEMAAFDAGARRRVMLYMAIAIPALALIAAAGAAAGMTLRRQLRLARVKTDLTAAVSHELRTPLASIQVLVDGLLADDAIDPGKTREYLHMVAGENARLSRVVENFLAFSRLERNRHTFSFEAVPPSAVIEAAMDAVADRVPAGCDLRVEVAPGLPAVRADAGALATAVANLLDNALKYTTSDKRITIRARRDGESFVAFLVEDNGVGIRAREQRRIFRRFYRVDDRLSRDTAGVGLGLSIVALIARGHGGTVTVRSEPGVGSTFTLRVPCAAEGAAA